MSSELSVFCIEEPHSEDLNLVKLVEFMGLRCNFIYLAAIQDSFGTIEEKISASDLCIAIRCETLRFIFQQARDVNQIKNWFFKIASFLFVYEIEPGESSNYVLPLITNNAIRSVSRFNDKKEEYTVSQNHDLTGELSGLTFGPINNSIDFKFVTAIKKKVHRLISIGNEDFFVSLKEQNCEIFMAATSKIIDIDSYLYKADSLKIYFSQFAPLMMFLKYVFKKACWHNDALYANFIIDDPLLRKNYGYLNYKKLLSSMYKYDFATTIAFIPWNYKKTDKIIAELFLKEKGKLSMCIHGCDHSNAEFATLYKNKLNSMLQLSKKRMDTQYQSTGLNYANVIVFPQGYFSKPAMNVLKKNNYLAAINTTAYPIDSDQIKISDFFDTAIMCHDAFPLFTRRYPHAEIIEFAIDAFLGKPLFIVEHHGYFKDGYEKNGKFIQQINSITKKIQWRGLSDVLTRCYMKRIGKSGDIFCKIYTNKVIIKNTFDVTKQFNVQKSEMFGIQIKSVFVNKNVVPYSIKNNVMEFNFELLPKETKIVEIVYKNDDKLAKYNKTLFETIKIISRHFIIRFRDNYISKNEFLLNYAYKIKRKLF